MMIRRWLSVLLIGSLAGVTWATVWVDVTPRWFDRLGTTPAVLLMLLPVALSFACGMAFEWWRLRVCVAYGIVVVAWHIAGALRCELANPDRGAITTFEWIGFGADLGLIVACWNMGRFLRRALHGEFGHGAGNPPADPELKTNNR